jgi:hypothetical protein
VTQPRTGAGKAPAPKRGSSPTDAYYTARGYGRIDLRLPLDVLAELRRRAESAGLTVSQFLAEFLK